MPGAGLSQLTLQASHGGDAAGHPAGHALGSLPKVLWFCLQQRYDILQRSRWLKAEGIHHVYQIICKIRDKHVFEQAADAGQWKLPFAPHDSRVLSLLAQAHGQQQIVWDVTLPAPCAPLQPSVWFRGLRGVLPHFSTCTGHPCTAHPGSTQEGKGLVGEPSPFRTLTSAVRNTRQ